MRLLIDTNVLLRLAEPEEREYPVVRRAVDTLLDHGDELCFIPQNLVEFWNVCTRPASRNGFGPTIAETNTRAQQMESKYTLLPDTERVHIEWRRLVVAHSVSGAQVHDARIVAAMLAHGVTQLITLNPRDFQRFTEITVLHPNDLTTD